MDKAGLAAPADLVIEESNILAAEAQAIEVIVE